MRTVELEISPGIVSAQLDIGDVHRSELFDVVRERLDGIFERHLAEASLSAGSLRVSELQDTYSNVAVPSTWGDLDSDTFRSKDVNKCLNSFQSKSSTVLDGSSPLVCTLVRSVVQELVGEIPVGRVH